MYTIQKSLNRLKNGQPTFFLDPKEQAQLKSKLKHDEYQIFYSYKDSERNIFYQEKTPSVFLFEIKSNTLLRHQDIMGSIFSLNIRSEMFGDILIIDNRYFIFVLSLIKNYFEANFFMVKDTYIELEQLPIDYLSDYERRYEGIELIVSSERVDTIISTLIHTGRSLIKEKQKKKEIILNYDFLKDVSYSLKVDDIFSIKGIGKFKYGGIVRKTKSGNFIVIVYKYL